MIRNIIALLILSVSLNAFSQVRITNRQINDELACEQWVEEQMRKLSLRDQIAQLFIHTVAPVNTKANRDNIANAVEHIKVGGLLFSGGEVEKQLVLQNYAQSLADIPLMITFDGEWGLSMRLKQTPLFPKNRVLGCIQNNELIYEYGREVARELKEIGVHVNLSPVTDIDNNPNNPVIGYRSFGSRPEQVAQKVVAYARGLEEEGVLAVCKHFPGHGDTNVDSHKALPVLKFTRERLDSVELHPFRAAFDQGVGGVMTGHLHVTSLSKLPASISPEIVSGLLKEELGFKGLVFTDALEMKGISSNVPVSANALLAGNDMLLAPRNLKGELEGVLSYVRQGKIKKEDIAMRCRKVLRFKYALTQGRSLYADENGIAERITTDATRQLMEKLDQAAITVVKNENNALPEMSDRMALLVVSKTLTETYPLYHELNKGNEMAWMRADVDSVSSIKQRLAPYDKVVIAIYDNKFAQYRPMLESIARTKPVVLVLFTDIKYLKNLSNVATAAEAVVLSHNKKDNIQVHTAKVLKGRAMVDGRLSVDIPGLFEAGQGVTLPGTGNTDRAPVVMNMCTDSLAKIDAIAKEGIEKGAYPGCHVIVLRKGVPVYDKCFGKHTYEGERQVASTDVYDLASMTKTTSTLLAVMKLYDEGRFSLSDRASKYVSYLCNTDKENITIEQLLYHESGIISYHPFYRQAIDLTQLNGRLFNRRKTSEYPIQVDSYYYAPAHIPFIKDLVSDIQSEAYPLSIDGKKFIKTCFVDSIRKQIADSKLKSRTYRYSCLNFMILKDMVENLSGVGMDVYLDSVFYKPMNLKHTSYHPLSLDKKENIVPTVKGDFLRKGLLQGYVHDEAAAFLGGVSGNAGLFSDAYDLARIYQLYLNGGELDGNRYISKTTCDLFTHSKSAHSRRALGFDKPDANNPDRSPCAKETPASVYGHTGFTGTCVWVDPDHDIIFIFLSNRIYPQPFNRKNLMRLNIRPRIQQMIYRSIVE